MPLTFPMTVIHSRATGSNTQNTESVLQHFYFVAAFAIVFALVVTRVIVLRKRHQSLSNFFRIGSSSPYSYGSHPPHDFSHGTMIHGIQLAQVPAAYRPDRRIRATDLDAHGRRLNPTGEHWEGKDALPAYDNLDRPPKYVEAGWSRGNPPPPTEQPATMASPDGEQSGAARPSTANGVVGNNAGQMSDGSRAAAGTVHASEEPPPPSHDSSDSS